MISIDIDSKELELLSVLYGIDTQKLIKNIVHKYIQDSDLLREIFSIINYYSDWFDDNKRKEIIKKMLDTQEADEWFDDNRKYSIGNDFSLYLNTYSELGYSDNHISENKIKEMLKENNFHNQLKLLEFDVECGYCYIYTNSRKTAEWFLEWSFSNIIKPKIQRLMVFRTD